LQAGNIRIITSDARWFVHVSLDTLDRDAPWFGALPCARQLHVAHAQLLTIPVNLHTVDTVRWMRLLNHFFPKITLFRTKKTIENTKEKTPLVIRW
jgi:hypothetical protein